MTVTEDTVNNATPEQIGLVAKLYLLVGKSFFTNDNLAMMLRKVHEQVKQNTRISGTNEDIKTINSARILIQEGSIASKLDHHVFPKLLVDEMLEKGVKVPVNPEKRYYEYYMKGSFKGKEGFYEVGVTMDPSGKIQKIDHKLFRYNDPKAVNVNCAIDTHELQQQRLAAAQNLKPTPSKTGLGTEPHVKLIENAPVKTGINYGALAENAQNAAKLGCGMSVVFNFHLLLNGDILGFGFEVAKDGVISAANSAAGDMLSNSLGDYAGPVSALVICALIDTKNLVTTGDIARFGKNLGINGISIGAGWGGGALIGMWLGPVGAIFGGLIGGFAGRYIAGKWIPGLSGLTKNEKNAFVNKVTLDMKAQGLVLKANTSYEKLMRMLDKGEIKLAGAVSWQDVVSGKVSSKTVIATGAYRGMIKTAFVFAELRSPTGNITDGLKLLIEDAKKLKSN